MTGRIRTVKPEWLEDEKVGASSDPARILSVALMLLADDHGRGRAHPLFIASRVWPYGEPHETLMKVSAGLEELARIGFVRLYSVAGQRYFEIRNWSKHQKVQHPSGPRVPSPDNADPEPPPPPPKPDREALGDQSQAQAIAGKTPSRGDDSRSALSVASRLALVKSSGDSHETLTPDPDLRSRSPITDQDHTRRVGLRRRGDHETAELFEHWRRVMSHPKARLDRKRLARCEWALKHYGLETAKLAIEGCARSDWHMGRDPRSSGRRFDDLGLIFRDAEHVERFLGMPEHSSGIRQLPSAADYAASATTDAELEEMFGDLTPEDLARIERMGDRRG
jgi:hypothetical protein